MLAEALTALRRAMWSYLLLAAVLAVSFAALAVFELQHAPSATLSTLLLGGDVGLPGTNPSSYFFGALLLALAGLIPTTWGLWRAAGKELLVTGSFGPRSVQIDTQNARRLSLAAFVAVVVLLVVALMAGLLLATPACGGHTGVVCNGSGPVSMLGISMVAATILLFVGLPGAVIMPLSSASLYLALRRLVPPRENARLLRGTGALIVASGLWVAGVALLQFGPAGAGVVAAGAVVLAGGLSEFVRIIAAVRARLPPLAAGVV
jgi:hypothetical protein